MAYYTFDNETGDDSSPNHYDAALINRPDIISDTPSNKGKAVYLKQAEKQYINIPYQLSRTPLILQACGSKILEQVFFYQL